MNPDFRNRPIPWRAHPPTSFDYHEIPLDPNDPRRDEELVDLADWGIAASGYYARSDRLNPPYYQDFAAAREQVRCRRSVAKLLQKVNRRLARQGVEIFVLNGYRSLEMQQVLWDFFMAQGRERLDDPCEPNCVAFAGTYCSDPRTFDAADSRTWPAHITGGAVDLTLRIRGTGETLFMGGIFDDPAELSHTAYYEKMLAECANRGERLPLSHNEALRNRRLLYWSMQEAGFVNYPYEWWHFDRGTQAWVRNQVSPSGRAERPRCAWYGPAMPNRTRKRSSEGTLTEQPMDRYLQAAIEEARTGLAEGGIPIGSVLVLDGQIVGRGHNRRVQRGSTVLHAEMDCLENAGRFPAAAYRRCVLYSTLSPCDMCSGAVLLYGIPRVVIGENRTFHGPEAYLRERGVELEIVDNRECLELMTEFIRQNPELWNEDIGE